uniref:RNA helicase n=1 Tax=Romanomermis culicivorax TaxID=13658 RepID=A0A915JC65_ROMCU
MYNKSRYNLSKSFVSSSASKESIKSAFPLPESVASATSIKKTAPLPRPPQAYSYGVMEYGMNARKRQLDDDEGLEEEDELEYIPAPDSPSASKENGSDDEDDPLDNFMAGIEVQARKDKDASKKREKETVSEPASSSKSSKFKLGRADIEEEDSHEAYFKWVEENADKLGVANDDDDEELEYDEEGNPLPPKKKIIDPLPPIDHSTISYEKFEKNFYIEHEQIESLTNEKVNDLRKRLDLKVTGLKPARPVTSFAHFGFDEHLLSVIRKSEFSQPTPIQSQAIPLAMSGRDVIGIAKTGSGKTAAFLWPALIHIIDQRQLEDGEGPMVLIVVPTRELAIQVYSEAKRYGKVYDIRTVCAYGGGSKYEQSKALQEGAEIVVCTPGRLIDLIKIKATNLQRVTYLVFDEADRMFELGFEPQVRSIANHIRPDRQCLMFSATFKKRIEKLARDILNDPIRIIQGELGEANEDITQVVEVFAPGPSKYVWLTNRLVGFCSEGKVLIFVSQKIHVEELAKNLKAKDFNVGILHGDLLQHERNEVITSFRKHRAIPILVATDVAARGLDIPEIKTVINFDAPRDIDTYIHRIGRTGRAGEKGYAYTLLVSEKDKDFAGFLVRNLESAGHDVPQKLLDLAMLNPKFKKTRFFGEKGKKPGVGGRGLGYRPGASKSTATSSLGGSLLNGFNATTSGIKQNLDTSDHSKSSDRLSTVKSAFQMTYKSAFHTAFDKSEQVQNQIPVTDPTPEWLKAATEASETVFKPPTSLNMNDATFVS